MYANLFYVFFENKTKNIQKDSFYPDKYLLCYLWQMKRIGITWVE